MFHHLWRALLRFVPDLYSRLRRLCRHTNRRIIEAQTQTQLRRVCDRIKVNAQQDKRAERLEEDDEDDSIAVDERSTEFYKRVVVVVVE